jgi:hypothetical protein
MTVARYGGERAPNCLTRSENTRMLKLLWWLAAPDAPSFQTPSSSLSEAS